MITQELINQIINDLGSNKSVKSILLKCQIIAFDLDNKKFSDWIVNEQNGYPNAENLPEYRVLAAIVKADVFVPYMGCINNMTIPAGIFEHDVINDCMGHVRITQSISEIEDLCNSKSDNSMLSFPMPAFAYTEVDKYVRGSVQRLWQEFPKTSLMHIIYIFKSSLLKFFLTFNKEIKGGFDFSQISSENNRHKINQIMNNTYNINAAVANTGDGTVNTGNISASNFQITPSAQSREQMNEIVTKLDQMLNASQASDANETLETIKEEVSKDSWNKKILKLAFGALKGVVTGVVVNKITPLVTEALALLA